MSRSGYITGTNHAATLQAAMEEFHRALTRRWREQVCRAIVSDSYEFPTRFRRAVSPHSHQPLWDFRSVPARAHFAFGGCAYVEWVNGGQNGALHAVRCDGSTRVSAREDMQMIDSRNGNFVMVPPHIECGVGSILAQVEDWAWGERDQVFHQLPMFDSHDVRGLHRAHDAFIRLGGRLGLRAGVGSYGEVRGSFDPMGERDIPTSVSQIASRDADGQDWWDGWTGLAARRAGAGFFASVAPTLNNQSRILGALANLYSDRAVIIEKGRNDALYWIQWATESLGATETITTDRTAGWKTVQGIGTGVAVSGGWSGVGAAAGATVVLVGFLGENLDPGTTTESHRHEISEVVDQLNDRIADLNAALDGYEADYRNAVTRLQTAIHGVHSFNLELYDLTQNDPTGDRTERDGGFHADVDSILRLAEFCYEAGGEYELLLPILAGTSEVDRSLAGRDGRPTAGDIALLEVRDQLEGFLRTTCGRYFVAGDQVRAAADGYVQVDTSQQERFDRTVGDWEDGVGVSGAAFAPEQEAEATDREGYDPWAGHPARAGGVPGAGDGGAYEVGER